MTVDVKLLRKLPKKIILTGTGIDRTVAVKYGKVNEFIPEKLANQQFDWGYVCARSNNLSFSILSFFLGDKFAHEHYKLFCEAFVANIRASDGSALHNFSLTLDFRDFMLTMFGVTPPSKFENFVTHHEYNMTTVPAYRYVSGGNISINHD